MTQTNQYGSSFFRNLGYVAWLVMLVMALVFYRERAFFMDAGFQLFNLINEGSIQVYHYRFVTAIPQFIPFFLLKGNLPLWSLAMAFSASYILFFLAVYHILVHYLKNDILGWTLLSLFTLISLDTFYHMQSEFYLGLALLLLTFGLVMKFPGLDRKWLFPAIIPLLVTIAFSHKLSLIFFFFTWLLLAVNRPELRHRRYLLFLGLFLLCAAVKSIYFTNWYEAAKQVDFQQNWIRFFPDFHAIPANKIFLERCLHHYYLLPLLLLFLCIFYLKNRQWIQPVLIFSFTIGYILFYHISDPESPFRFYSEVTYLPASIFVSLPFFLDVAPRFSDKTAFKILITAVLVSRLAVIAGNRTVFKRNLDWIEQKLESPHQPAANKWLLKLEDAPLDTILMSWGVPFTAMHLSALKSPDSARTLLIMPDFQWYDDKMARTDLFFSPFHKVIAADSLNKNYYNLANGKYQWLDK